MQLLSYALAVHNLVIAIPLFPLNLMNLITLNSSYFIMALSCAFKTEACISCVTSVDTQLGKTVEGLKTPLTHPLLHSAVESRLAPASPAHYQS